MDRRQILGAGLALGASGAFPAVGWAQRKDAAALVYDNLIEGALTASPQNATLYALDEGARSNLKRQLDDRSAANRLKLYDPFLRAAPGLATLPPESDPRRRQWLETIRWFAGATGQMAATPNLTVDQYGYPIPYAVSQLSGATFEVPDLLATQHVIETSADCEAYIARLGEFGRAIDQDTEMSRVQAAAGLVPPDFICNGAIGQLDSLAAGRGAQAGLVQALVSRAHRAGIAGDWEGRAVALVDGPIAAALARQREQLTALRRLAVPAAGIGARAGGDAFYAMALGFHITTGSTPQDVHRLGLDQAAASRAEIDALLIRLGHSGGSVGARLTVLGKDPTQLFPNDDAGRTALLAYVRERSEDVKRRLPTAFNRMPRTPMDIRRVPVETEAGSPLAYSLPGSLDGVKPGTIYLNLSDTANWPRWQLPSTVYHEGYPATITKDRYWPRRVACRCCSSCSSPMRTTKAGRSMQSSWPTSWVSTIRLPSAASAASRRICSARAGWSSTRASTPLVGAAKRRSPILSMRVVRRPTRPAAR